MEFPNPTNAGRLLSVVAALTSAALVGSACGGSSRPTPIEKWAYDGISISYPGTLAPGTLQLTKAAAQTGCLCHTVIPPSGTPLKEVHSQAWLYDGDKHSGVAISIIDATNDGADTGTAADGAISGEGAASIAAQLGLPVDPQSTAPYPTKAVTVAHHPATYFVAQGVTAEDAPTVTQETWMIYRPMRHDLYVLTCQYASDHGSGTKDACQAIVDSLAVD